MDAQIIEKEIIKKYITKTGKYASMKFKKHICSCCGGTIHKVGEGREFSYPKYCYHCGRRFSKSLE